MLEKAKAAKDIGAKKFIVPIGQGIETNIIPKEECIKGFGLIYCETRYEEYVIDISTDAGISVIEVKNIEQAIEHFIE